MLPYVITLCGMLSLFLFLAKRDKKGSVEAVALKALTSLFFIATGISACFIVIQETKTSSIEIALFLVLGLILGMVGDIFLDFKIYFKALNMRFLCFEHDYDILMVMGMTSFGIGHVFYIIASFLLCPTDWCFLVLSLCFGLLAILLIMTISIRVMKMDFRKFKIPCTIYGFLLGSFGMLSVLRVIMDFSIGRLLLMIGSLLFLVSDLILTITYFSKKEDYDKTGFLNPESKFMIVTNHVTYYFAQFLIALSILYLF